jgi:D-alanyl-lipoteichoic acid acyltransferase DltB (MBOAT superfamily)
LLDRGSQVLFPTIRFAIFFCLVLPASWLLMPRPLRWKLFMLVASFTFYGAWDWRFCFLLAASIIGNQVLAVGIQRRIGDGGARKRWTAAAVAANLAVLGWFKYAGWLAGTGNSLFSWFGLDWELPIPAVALPIGISFFTFQALSYVIDVSRRQIRPVGLLDFAVYLSFFPHLVAGPIVRASEFLPQLRSPRDPRRVETSLGLWLIAAGLVKKVVVATYLAEQAVDPLFGVPAAHGGVEALVGVYAYAIQIYADFSGYTDIAIGLALLLGFRFPQNFDAPYTAASLQDFWRRWHMTLSRWLRDYVYVPLGGNRGARWHTYANLMLTMVLGGIWHGAAWTFVVWGLLHGLGMAAERWVEERRLRRSGGRSPGGVVADDGPGADMGAAAAAPGAGYGTVLVAPAPSATTAAIGVPASVPSRRWLRRVVTFHFVCLGWVFFRSESIEDAIEVLGRIAFGSGSVPVNPVVVLVIAAMLAAQFVPPARVERARETFAGWRLPTQVAALATVLLVVDVLGPDGVAPFIYFRF